MNKYDYGERSCLVCGRAFRATFPGQITCSEKCRKEREKKRNRQRNRVGREEISLLAADLATAFAIIARAAARDAAGISAIAEEVLKERGGWKRFGIGLPAGVDLSVACEKFGLSGMGDPGGGLENPAEPKLFIIDATPGFIENLQKFQDDLYEHLRSMDPASDKDGKEPPVAPDSSVPEEVLVATLESGGISGMDKTPSPDKAAEIPKVPDDARYCERMRVKSANLPCGTRGECFNGGPCEHVPEGVTAPTRRCVNCGGPLPKKAHHKTLYCSPACREEHARKKKDLRDANPAAANAELDGEDNLLGSTADLPDVQGS